MRYFYLNALIFSFSHFSQTKTEMFNLFSTFLNTKIFIVRKFLINLQVTLVQGLVSSPIHIKYLHCCSTTCMLLLMDQIYTILCSYLCVLIDAAFRKQLFLVFSLLITNLFSSMRFVT
jgi:hypothetical protein